MTTTETQIERDLIEKLTNLKYKLRSDIRDRTALETNFRQKFQELNRVTLTEGEFHRLRDEIVSSDVFTYRQRQKLMKECPYQVNLVKYILHRNNHFPRS